MEKLYRNYDGEWFVSMWKNGRFYITKEDGHTVFKELVDRGDETIEIVGHDNCPCMNPLLNKKLKLKKI